MTTTLAAPPAPPKTASATGSVICTRAGLVEILSVISGVMKARTPNEALQCARIATVARSLRLSGTNLQSWVAGTSAQVQVESPMDVAVPCDRILDILRELPTETVKLVGDGPNVLVVTDAASFKVPTQDIHTIPQLPTREADADVYVPSKAFARMVRQSLVSVAKAEKTYAISGVLIVVDNDGYCSMVSSSGHSLTKSTFPEKVKAKPFSMIVPTDAISLVEKSLGAAESVHVSACESAALFDVGDVRIDSVLVEGQFPPYEDIIPRETAYKVTLKRGELQQAIRQAMAIAAHDELRPGLRVTVTPKAGLGILAKNKAGEADVTLPCKVEGKEPFDIGLNAKYLASAINVIEAPEIVIELNSFNRPIVIRAGAEYTHVLMPINI